MSSTPTRANSRSAMNGGEGNLTEDAMVTSTPLSELTEDKERERSRLLLAQFYGAMAEEDSNGQGDTPGRPIVNNKQIFDTTDIGRF